MAEDILKSLRDISSARSVPGDTKASKTEPTTGLSAS